MYVCSAPVCARPAGPGQNHPVTRYPVTSQCGKAPTLRVKGPLDATAAPSPIRTTERPIPPIPRHESDLNQRTPPPPSTSEFEVLRSRVMSRTSTDSDVNASPTPALLRRVRPLGHQMSMSEGPDDGPTLRFARVDVGGRLALNCSVLH